MARGEEQDGKASAVSSPPSEKTKTMPLRDDQRVGVPEVMEYVPRKRGFLELVSERVVAAAEESGKVLGRKVLKKAPDGRVTRPRVVVLGSGWGAHAMIKMIDTEKFDLIVVSPRNYFVFTPMLASSAVGTVELRSVCEPIRQCNEFMNYYEGKCVEVNAAEKKIICEHTGQSSEQGAFEVPYSYLVVAVGAAVNTFGIPGVEENLMFLKEVSDAARLRRAIVDRFERANLPETTDEERARLLHFVIVGGGPTGVELTAELNDFLRQDLIRFYPKLVGEVRLTLLEAGPSILTQFDESLQRRALERFEKLGVKVCTGAMVTRVTEDAMELKDGTRLEYGMGVWAAGVGTQPLVRELMSGVEEQQAARGRLIVDEWLRVKGLDGVFALGDCAQIASNPLPLTGQVASQQGAYLARLLNKDYCLSCELPTRGPTAASLARANEIEQSSLAKPFQFLSLGILAYIGSNQAVSQVEAGNSGFRVNLAGYTSYLIWRSAYLAKQVSLRNRMSVLFDWTRSFLFGRDISHL
eukprot:CAMPEP_0185845544 /NCGR_PEP_ID=MMETSP1354-20130828/1483_1 /TAXON_ID=708628 /ORGANISM="Erythrolobus madagascarensis, Strain CCMP3276" /LENGTH=524 /DNA_ID=CAMNT_0028545531 /DNA_START=282 /DNA_END=1856 /DNA_ORIENTATION=+